MAASKRSLSGRSRKGSFWLKIIILLVALYAIAGFWVAPYFLRPRLEARLASLLDRPVKIQTLKMNPFALSVTVRGFRIGEKTGHEPLLSFDRLYVNFETSSLIHQAWTFSEIDLVNPFFRLVRNPNQSLNIDDVVARLTQKSETAPKPKNVKPEGIPSIRIGTLSIKGGKVALADYSLATPFKTEVTPIDLTLTDFTTGKNSKNPYSLAGKFGDGATFSWSGAVHVAPVRSNGVISVQNVAIGYYQPILNSLVGFKVSDGRLSLKSNYTLNLAQPADPIDLSDGSVNVENLNLTSPTSEAPVVSIPNLDVAYDSIALVPRKFRFSTISTSSGTIHAVLDKNRQLNLLALLAPPQADTASSSSAQKTVTANPMDLTVSKISVHNYTFDLTDQSVPTPAHLTVGNVESEIDGLSTLAAAPAKVSVKAKLNQAGDMDASGTFSLDPLAANVNVKGDNVLLADFQPYIEPIAKIRVVNGSANVDGKVDFTGKDPAHPELDFSGQAGVTGLAVNAGTNAEPLVDLKSFKASGINFKLAPLSLGIDTIAVTGGTTHIDIDSKQNVNLAGLMVTPPAAKQPSAAPAQSTPSAAQPMKITIGRVSIADSAVALNDHSVSPAVHSTIGNIDGTVSGLSSEEMARADVDIHAKVDNSAKISITGKINPLSKKTYTKLNIACSDLDLTSFSPYTAKYVGYQLDKGILSLNLDYKLSAADLDGQNSIHFNQLTLGSKSDSAQAVKLPVKLALALLTDREGRIDLDVPVHGNLNDPKFSIGGVVVKAFVNVITKLVTSPFAMFSSMFGGGENLDTIIFSPGVATVSEADAKKIAVIEKALYARPKLSLDILGKSDPATDDPALREMALKNLLLTYKRNEVGGNPQATTIAPDEEAKYLKLAYYAKFPEAAPKRETTTTTQTKSTPAAEQPEKKSGMFGFLHHIWPFGKKQPETAQKAPSTTPAPSTAQPEQPAGPSVEKMRSALLATIDITPSDLHQLAQQRAQAVKSAILASGKVEPERVFIVEAGKAETSPKKLAGVKLTLR